VRILVRILAALLGLGVAACGAVLAVEVAWGWVRPGRGPLLVPWPQWRAYLDGVTWNSTVMRVVAGALAVIGLVLLLIAANARRRDVRLQDPIDDVSVVTSPASVARVVGHRIRAEDNVSGASVTATANRIRVRASSRLESEEQLMPRLLRVTRETVDGLPLARTPRITVVVDSTRDRRR
jgi:hypothetical protein